MISYAGSVHGLIYGWMDVFESPPTLSHRDPEVSNLQTRLMAEFTYMMDGSDGRGIKSILLFSSYFVEHIYIYLPIYIYIYRAYQVKPPPPGSTC